jgi:uncharacterized protein YeeX (DUF496 family)
MITNKFIDRLHTKLLALAEECENKTHDRRDYDDDNEARVEALCNCADYIREAMSYLEPWANV